MRTRATGFIGLFRCLQGLQGNSGTFRFFPGMTLGLRDLRKCPGFLVLERFVPFPDGIEHSAIPASDFSLEFSPSI
jgi:hypothetical protein